MTRAWAWRVRKRLRRERGGPPGEESLTLKDGRTALLSGGPCAAPQQTPHCHQLSEAKRKANHHARGRQW